MAASGLHISISAEPIAHIGGLTISNSIATSLIASVLLIGLAFIVNRQLRPVGRPTGLQNVFEFIIESLFNLVNGITGSADKTKKFFPLVATLFLFILFNNWLGLLPGVGTIGFTEKAETQAHETVEVSDHAETGAVIEATQTHLETTEEAAGADSEHEPAFVPYLRAGTADLNTTLALAITTMVGVQIFGVSYRQFRYFTKFLDFSSPIMFFVGILELISEFGKIISFAFRLFGNVFAGEVLLAVIGFLVPLVVPMPFYGLEIFVGFIQALVFALLSTVFYNMATLGHEEH